MSLGEILKKVVAGEELSAEEKAYLAEYDPEVSPDGRIPKSRLDAEIAKRKTEKERADKLETDLATLQEKVEELENAGKSDAEKAKANYDRELGKLQKQVSELTKERDEARANFEKSERTAKISALAAKHNFSDAKYLDYLTASGNIDLDDEKASTEFMRELGKSSPQLFKSTARPGGGTNPGGKDGSDAKKRIEELLKKPELSSRESAEVIKLQQGINAEKANDNSNGNKSEGE